MAKVIELNHPRTKELCLQQLKQSRKRLRDNEAESWKGDLYDFLISQIEAQIENEVGPLLSVAI